MVFWLGQQSVSQQRGTSVTTTYFLNMNFQNLYSLIPRIACRSKMSKGQNWSQEAGAATGGEGVGTYGEGFGK